MPITDQLAAGDLLTLGLFWGFIAYRWVRQRQLRLPEVRPGAAAPVSAPPLVSVIVPARNEAPHVATCVRSLLAQDYPNFEVIVVDDGSDDGTGALVAELAQDDARLTLITGGPLPDGWMGKAHACTQGYQRARGDWLLFTDADTEHAPWLLSGVMAEVRRSPASFATVIGTQRHPTVGAFLANLPVFTYIYLVTDPAAWLDPRSRQSLVNGQYLLFAREAYEAIGTHAAARQYSSTDVSLGYLAKRDGWQPLLLDGRPALWTTMYRDFADAFRGWTRSLVNGSWTTLGPGWGSLALLLVTAGMWWFWVNPWVRLFSEVAGTSESGAAVSSVLLVPALQILASWTFVRMVRDRWSETIRDALLMPGASVLFTIMALWGLVRAWIRRGTVWKGRLVRTTERLPPWTPKPPRARSQVSGLSAED